MLINKSYGTAQMPRNFPGGPGVKTLPFKAGAAGLIPGKGAKSHMPRSQKKKKKSKIEVIL